MRGEQEEKCLNTVRSILRTRKNCLGCLDENDNLLQNINLAQAKKITAEAANFFAAEAKSKIECALFAKCAPLEKYEDKL